MAFPRHTGSVALHPPGSFRALSRSLIELAALTGVVLRLGRSFLLGLPAATNLVYVGGVYVVGAAFLLGMAALHLSNYPVCRWVWRAPAFAAVEITAELLTSLLLIALGREPWGTASAGLHDWPTIARSTVIFRGLVLLLPFSLILAAIVQGVRAWMARGRRSALTHRHADGH